MLKPFHIIVVLISSFLVACSSDTDTQKEQLIGIAEKFTKSLYNYDFESAFSYCTESSRKWIMFYASNVTEEALKMKNDNILSEVETKSVSYTNDSTALVNCFITNKISLSSSDNVSLTNEQVTVMMVKRENKWLVKMEGPLQSGK